MLLERKADTEISGNQGHTPLLMAAQLGFPDVFETLVRSGAKFDAKLPSGETAAELAGAAHCPEIAEFLAAYRRELKERRQNSAFQY